jgi:hypothetical protein
MATEVDKVNTGALATIAAVLGFSVLGIAFAVTALVRHEEDSLVDNRSQGARAPYDEMRAEQQDGLANGNVPIETAMKSVVEGLKADPNSATPISPNADAGAAAPETTDAGEESTDAAAEESAAGEATEESADATAAPETTEDAGAAPKATPDAGAKPKKPKPTGGATPPAPPPTAPPPTLPTPTAP